MKINLSNIKNIIVQRALAKRNDDFMFSSLFGKGNSSSSHTDWNEHGDYSERSSHTDDTAGRKVSSHTDHTETAYEEHSEYSVYEEHYDNSYFEVNRR